MFRAIRLILGIVIWCALVRGCYLRGRGPVTLNDLVMVAIVLDLATESDNG